MPAPARLIGRVFHHLEVIAEANKGAPKGARFWDCRCSCGKIARFSSATLLSGRTKACGHLKGQHLPAIARKHGHALAGARKSSEYRTWETMRRRCRDPKADGYEYYGGRGITVCPEWEDFSTFLRDMGPRPSPRHSIDRRDNDGPYAPWNCYWATPQEQQGNKRNTNYILFQGQRMSLTEAARRAGLSPQVIRHRKKRGWPESRWFAPAGPWRPKAKPTNPSPP